MNLDQLKSGWRDAHERHLTGGGLAVHDAVQATAKRFESSVTRTAIVETGCAGLIVAFFAWGLWDLPAGMLRNSVLLMMVSVAWAAGVLLWSGRRDPRPDRGVPVSEFSRAELARIDRRVHLLRRISWWYSLPVLGSAGLFLWSVVRIEPSMPWILSLLFMTGFGLCLVWAANIIHRINRRAIEDDLLPLREKLTRLLQSLEESAQS